MKEEEPMDEMDFAGFGGASDALERTILSSPLLGGGLPPPARAHLHKAAERYHLTDIAETHLHAAAELAPDHAAVLIALYRFYFYKGRLVDALDVARACVVKALRENLLGDDWRAVRPGDADFGDWGALLPRFFLFSLKGYAYLNLRLGALGEGRDAAKKLLSLDPRDRIGAKVLIDVLDRMEHQDD
jgi:tetratricopeptide (TPR) repeat protein